MKIVIASFILLLTLTQNVNSQNITADTTLAKLFIVKATEYDTSTLFDSAAVFYHKAALLYRNHKMWEDYLENERKHSKAIFANLNHDEALHIIEKAIDTSISYLDSNNLYLAHAYNFIGIIYERKSNDDKALYYYKLSLDIRLNSLGENHLDVADSYYNMGIIFRRKDQLALSHEYYMKTLHIYNQLLPEKHKFNANLYNEIGILYIEKKDYKMALKYLIKSLDINKSIYGDEHHLLGAAYLNIGTIYQGQEEYETALEYYFKALRIYKKEYHSSVNLAIVYSNISMIYLATDQIDLALEYVQKCSKISKTIFGENHIHTLGTYIIQGQLYTEKKEFNLAIAYYQKAIYANLNIKSDSGSTFHLPAMTNYVDQNILINALMDLADIYSDSTAFSPSIENKNYVLKLYQMSDTVMTQTRTIFNKQSDKIMLSLITEYIYNKAIDMCLQLDSLNLAFEYSEKNKAMVLQTSMANANAMQFAGIPDSLLQQENDLQQNIALYTQKLAEEPDSTQEVLLSNNLFTANRIYEKLIANFETNYKDYYAIKHDNKIVSVQEIQNSLNDKTCMVSYFTADNAIYISSISKNSFKLIKVDKPDNFEKQVALFQKAILTKNNIIYTNYGEKLYKTLFPENSIAQDIENLVLIPDGALTTIPFEVLLNNNEEYLIKDYNISYAYSANLWYQKQNKPTKTYDYDFLAFAPVFADGSTAGTTLRTRSMFAEMDSLAYATDSIATRGNMLNGEQITALPATESEVTDIFNLYKKRHKKALVKTHALANEVFAKSDTLSNSKIIHIATHGFVNKEKPELSGILLAQNTNLSKHENIDSVGIKYEYKQEGEDGILYSGEIYNLNLNADLVVLSACETGLGQIKQGEGVIGLTRALMYAGADNLMVSLWKVSDESTDKLMVDFYTKMLKDKKNKKSYSQLLRKAKLEMIDDGTYSHPYYWSPFVLIGE
ncbi:MAG: CHAT domain-containing protein [Salinivirgaceae bacterium]|nr:CHAT domain-containing protein [Salinivirgaceae bacterium]